MKDFEKIGKKMPFNESQDYIDSLINRSVESAISGRKTIVTKPLIVRYSIISAAAAIVIGLIFTFNATFNTAPETPEFANAQSIDNILNSMSDEQILALTSYSIDEEIPEY